MQYFLTAAFCWMLIEGIYLYFFVVKVYNINTKMYMYHVISWGEFFYFKTCTGNCNHALGSPNLVLSCSKVFDFLLFVMVRSSSDYGGNFTWHRCWKRRVTKRVRVINSKKKKSTVCCCSSPFNSLQLILCFVFAYSLKSVSFHLLRICVSFLCFISSILAAGFPRLTT